MEFTARPMNTKEKIDNAIKKRETFYVELEKNQVYPDQRIVEKVKPKEVDNVLCFSRTRITEGRIISVVDTTFFDSGRVLFVISETEFKDLFYKTLAKIQNYA